MAGENNTSIAVIGGGYWGKNLVRVFHELGVLGAVCDSSDDCLAALQSQYPGTRLVSSVDDILKNDTIKGVAIATPAETHFEIALRAIKAGKDVMVEKPLALRVDDGKCLVKSAQENRRVLMVGHVLRYHYAVRALARLIRDGVLGRVRYIYSNRLNMGRIRQEENILWSFAPHDISVILYLLGEDPRKVACSGGSYLNRNVADVTVTQLQFSHDVRAHIFVSWLHPFKEQRLVVVGDQQMAVFDDAAADKLVVYPHQVEWVNRMPCARTAEGQPVPLNPVEPLQEECRHFLACMENRSSPCTDGAEGLRVLRVLHAAEQSMQCDGKFIPLQQQPHAADFFVHETACIDKGAKIGAGTKVWHYSHIQSGAQIGENCVIGQNVNVDGAIIGHRVKIQNNVSVYTGVEVEDDVFLGPSCVLTNVSNPRSAINRHGQYAHTRILFGATIGANATLCPGVTIGRHAFIGAGAPVTKDVSDYALMLGNPARQAGWMSRHGHRLKNPDAAGIFTCPESGLRYQEDSDGRLVCLDAEASSAP